MIRLVIIAAIAIGSVLSMASHTIAADTPTILITGSNRGMGLEFASQFATKGWNVIATCRNPSKADALNALAAEDPNVTIEELDVLEHGEIDALAQKYEGQPIDVLLSNAGILGGFENQIFGQLNYEIFNDIMRTNALGPLKLAEAFIDNIAASDQKKIMTVSSTAGSFTHPEINMGGLPFYRASKSATNMIMHSLSKDLASREIIVGILSPPLTRNDEIRKAEEERGIKLPAVEPEESVRGLIEVIESFTLGQSGSFINYTGDVEPW